MRIFEPTSIKIIDLISNSGFIPLSYINFSPTTLFDHWRSVLTLIEKKYNYWKDEGHLIPSFIQFGCRFNLLNQLQNSEILTEASSLQPLHFIYWDRNPISSPFFYENFPTNQPEKSYKKFIKRVFEALFLEFFSLIQDLDSSNSTIHSSSI